jgi:hypothetical protein
MVPQAIDSQGKGVNKLFSDKELRKHEEKMYLTPLVPPRVVPLSAGTLQGDKTLMAAAEGRAGQVCGICGSRRGFRPPITPIPNGSRVTDHDDHPP